MPVNLYPKNEELDGIETEALIDILADCTSRYTRLLVTDPNSEEFSATKDFIERIQVTLSSRVQEDGTFLRNESGLA